MVEPWNPIQPEPFAVSPEERQSVMMDSALNLPVNARPRPEGICAIIVTYFPDAHFGERLERIRRQVGQVLIIDNTDEERPSEFLRLIDFDDVEIIKNKENEGIGAALNQGMSRTIELGYEWALTFDQDSWVDPDLVKVLIGIYRLQPRPELVGIIGCNFEDENTHIPSMKCVPGAPIFREIEAVVTSGSFLRVSTFSKVGPFRSDFFIDFIDHEYCLRLLDLGYEVIISTAPLMVHAFGAGSLVSPDGAGGRFGIILTNRSPLRRYYMTRNGLIVAKRYFSVAPKWVLRSVASLLVYAVLKIPWEQNSRRKKLFATLYGAFDAIRSRTGKANADWLKDQDQAMNTHPKA
jgi:rhamnosyltransferase